MDENEYLLTSEVQKILRYKNIRSVDRAMRDGLPFIKLNGRDVRFRRRDVDGWMEKKRRIR